MKLVVGDKCLGMLEAVGEVVPQAKYQRCTVHFYRNVFSVVPRSKVKLVAKILQAIHAQENWPATLEMRGGRICVRPVRCQRNGWRQMSILPKAAPRYGRMGASN